MVEEKSTRFAQMVKSIYQYLVEVKKEHVMSSHFLQSGTAVAALVSEAAHGPSNEGFLSRITQAIHEANESKYWLNRLKDTGYLTLEQHEHLQAECSELCKLLMSIVKPTSVMSLRLK